MKIYSAAIDGLNLTLTEVESDIARGLPSFTIVGLGDASIKEARERIRAALKNSGYTFPVYRKVVSLSPASVKKQGSHFDLPITLSMLAASGQIKRGDGSDPVFCAGEVKLDGSLSSVPGVLALTYFASKRGFKRIFVPFENRDEAALIKEIEVLPVKNLQEIVAHFEGNKISPYISAGFAKKIKPKTLIDFAEIKGHEIPKRALEIASAGGHHILMVGPPGTGKTMLAKAAPGIQPYLDEKKSMEVNMIYSVSGKARGGGFPIIQKPFRHVSQTITSASLLGGGTPFKLGEATLAHNGILFLDELAEFQSQILEELREPLQEGVIRIGRHGKTSVLPASFQLIAAMNPCPCGYFGDIYRNCQCTPYQIKKYYKKISGPILDRIDIITDVGRVPRRNLFKKSDAETSSEIRKRINKALEIQQNRGKFNSELQMKDVKKICSLNKEGETFIADIIDKLHISPRSYLSILKVARTIADLEQCEGVNKSHIAEAVQYKKSFEY